jgi:hypothetical protein
MYATWVSPDDVVGEPIWLGWSNDPFPDRPRWLAWEGALHGTLHATLDTAAGPPSERQYLRIWSLTPGGDIRCQTSPDLPVLSNMTLPSTGFRSGGVGYNPATLATSGPTFGLVGISSACREPLANSFRTLVIEGCSGRPRWLESPGMTCVAELDQGVAGLAAVARGTELAILWSSFEYAFTG